MEAPVQPVIWIYQGDSPARAAELAKALAPGAASAVLGPAESGAELLLGEPADLALALNACPPPLRPAGAVMLTQARPAQGWECLPCPLLYWGEGAAPLGFTPLPGPAGEAAEALRARASQPFRPAWMAAAQVNLPLREFFGNYQALVKAHPVNLEIGLDAMALDTLGPEHLERARAILAGRRLTAHLPFMDLAPGSVDPAVAALARKRLLAAGEWAVSLGAKNAVMHTGYMKPLHRDLAGFAKRFAENVGPLALFLAKGGCTLAMENVFEPGPSVLLALTEALEGAGASVGFCLDVGHALAFSRTDLDRWFQALCPRILEMHLHDNDGRDDLHLPPGQGLVDWAYLRRELATLSPKPILTLEPHNEPHLWADFRALERLWGRPEELGAA